jgi:hypothetical protein
MGTYPVPASSLRDSQKSSEARCYWLAPVILATWGAEDCRLRPAWANISGDPISEKKKKKKKKKPYTKRGSGVDQAVEVLLCKHEALSSTKKTSLPQGLLDFPQ